MNNNLFLMWSSSTESGMLQCTVSKADNWSPVSKGATSDWNHLKASKYKSQSKNPRKKKAVKKSHVNIL